jgi:hypothetical protein
MMCNTIKTLFISITICLVLLGCTSESDSQEQAPKPRATAPTPQVVPVTPSRTTVTMSLAGITLKVAIKGTLSPGAEIDVELVQTSGSPAIAIRLWVGNETGVGSAKTKSHSHGASHHAVPQAPNPLPANSALWIEIESAMGERESGSIALN